MIAYKRKLFSCSFYYSVYFKAEGESKMKFAVVLLIIVGSTFCGAISQKQVAIENERFFYLIGGISSMINQLIESVKAALNGLVVQTQTWIQNEIKTIEDIITNGINSFNQYIKDIKAELEVLVNEQLKPCLQEFRENIKAVEEETKREIKNCRDNGWKNLKTIQEDVENYKMIHHEAVQNLADFIDSCKNQPNFGDKIKCAVDASRLISTTIGVLRENIKTTTQIVSEKIKITVFQTRECIAEQLKNGQFLVQEIFEETRRCLKDGSTTTTETPETESTTTSEAEPTTSSEVEPTTTSETDPTTTEAEQTTTSEVEPTTSSEAEPTTTSEAEPTTTSEAEQTTTSQAEPTTSSEAEPTTTSEVELTSSSEAEPTTTSEAAPTTSSEAEPTTTSEAEPSTTSEAAPTTTSVAEPATTSEAAPTTENGNGGESQEQNQIFSLFL